MKTPSRPSASPARDYCAIALAYAERAADEANARHFGKWIRLAARRFLSDLQRTQDTPPPFYFDPERANHACGFIECLPHVEGKWKNADGSEQSTIVLHESDVFFSVSLFGFRKPDGSRRFTTALKATARKNAKALALDTPIPTPTGWTTMGDLREGDEVLGTDGRACRVLATSEVFHDHDCYRLSFSNGEQVTADAGHLWHTTARVDRPGGPGRMQRMSKTRVRTTQEIVGSLRHAKRQDVNHSMPMPAPIAGIMANLPVPPYSLGAWLGDGTSAAAQMTLHPSDLEIVETIRAEGTPMRKANVRMRWAMSTGDHSQKCRNEGFASKLRALGVLKCKHIPPAYLRASYAQRLMLLQGLMDTDGTISKSGLVLSFTNTNERLARGFAELLATFGVKFSLKARPMRCNGAPVAGVAWLVQFMAFRDQIPVFRLSRKLYRMRLHAECDRAPRSRTVQIVDAQRVPTVPVKCIAVDAPDHQFLFGRTMLPTHNSTIAGGIGLYCQACEDELGPQIISGATTGSQARVIFNIAKRMVESTAGLRKAFGMEAFANSVTSYGNGGSFKPINAKASSQDGLNPSVVLLDEIHAHKTHDLLNVLRSAAGARSNPLFLFTTTEGYENAGPWPEMRTFAMQVLEGVVQADHFLVVYYAVDEEDKANGIPADDDFDESAWVKANPLMEVNPILLTELRKEAIEAKAMPGRHAEFKVKRLNRPSSVAGGWVNLTKWRQCAGPVDLDKMRPFPCWGGLDLASVGDFSSFRLVWLVEGHWYTHGWRFVPRAAVHRRTQRGLVPYQQWVQSGHLIVAGDEVTDYDVVQETIIGVNDRFDVKVIGYDPWNAAQLVKKLEDSGVPLKEFIQGPKTYHPAMQALERAYTSGHLSHGNDPVLNWCAANVIARTDVNMNTAPDKKRAPEKIDDMVALLEAFGVAQAVVAAAPKFQLLTI